MDLLGVYRLVTATPTPPFADVSFAQVLLIGLAVVAGLFFLIQLVAYVMGFALARSITGAVHELFEGTEQVRQGDFSHKINVPSQDQLGELASSFNTMTTSIEDLLRQKAQKDRLEQELEIARGIQMSLLPQAPLEGGGVLFSGYCEPARAVGGDYYDFWPIDDHRYRHADRRRGRQGHLGGAVHGGAEGHRAVAQPVAQLAAAAADRRQPHHLAAPRLAQLHHHDLRRRGRACQHAHLRARGALPAHPPARPACTLSGARRS